MRRRLSACAGQEEEEDEESLATGKLQGRPAAATGFEMGNRLAMIFLERMISTMWIKLKLFMVAMVFVLLLSVSSSAQSAGAASLQREPAKPARPFVVLTAQSLGDLERKLQPDNKVEELIGGPGMQLRVAVQHDKSRPTAAAELHDASDDVYYVLEGTATLTLGGRLDAPREAEPGEWRSPRIIGGQTFEIVKGDLIIVPRGTPHQRTTAAGKEFSMILIKVYAEPLRPVSKKPEAKLPGPTPQKAG
jgi:mannose-6-phosphate isomerase-like protein (cupin superfamily)